ncbi:MAG: sigma-70 family RNA polymerase sigma factor, partial [Flavobacteriaceae bacterium]|nr:sigma-70 family RNA polymerase sigma factor [Flavobacteriaceae bacterium]
KIKLFTMTSKRLDEIIATEEFHKDTLSTSELLSKELEKLEEKFEIDLDNDLLMSDELDDISYKQDASKSQLILYDDAEKNIIETLELDDDRAELTDKKRLVLNKIYNWLPLETSNVLDLFVFGKLTYDEIALVKGISPDEVKETIRSISKNFRKNLN